MGRSAIFGSSEDHSEKARFQTKELRHQGLSKPIASETLNGPVTTGLETFQNPPAFSAYWRTARPYSTVKRFFARFLGLSTSRQPRCTAVWGRRKSLQRE